MTGGATNLTGGSARVTGGATNLTGGSARETGGASNLTGGSARETGGASNLTGSSARVTGGLSKPTGGSARMTGGSACVTSGSGGSTEANVRATGGFISVAQDWMATGTRSSTGHVLLRWRRMLRLTVDTAASRLPDLVQRAQGGESVVIVSNDLAVQLVPIAPPQATRPRPCFGSAAGQVRMAPDFDAPLDDFDDYTK